MNPRMNCNVCGADSSTFRAYAVHLHNEHGPPEAREPAFPSFNAFSWVVVQRPSDGKFLLVQEPAAIAGGRPAYWFPAGRVDEGETFVQAGVREAEEEAGVQVEITGLLTVMIDGGVCPRVVLYGVPIGDDDEPKSIPDFESCGAAWLDIDQINQLSPADFRGEFTAELYNKVAVGKLEPLPIDTEAFAALESSVSTLTVDQPELEPYSPEELSLWSEAMAECATGLFAEYGASSNVLIDGLHNLPQ